VRYSAGLLIVLLFSSVFFHACDPEFITKIATYGLLTGVIYDDGGNRLQGAIITIDPDLEPGHKPVVSDSIGEYNFGYIKPGTYTVTASLLLFSKVSRKVTIKENTNSLLNFALSRYDASLLFSWVPLPGGGFYMGDIYGEGDADERPVHPVRLSSFSISRYETTYSQYDEFCDQTGRVKPPGINGMRGSLPVVNVTYEDAKAFCLWASAVTGSEIRLPTEAEWEYAARCGGDTTRYSGTNDASLLADYAWFLSNSKGNIYPVQMKEPNRLGISDLSGNVWEWVSDFYAGNYYQTCLHQKEVVNPQGPAVNAYKVIRGGSMSSSTKNCRTVNRESFIAVHSSPELGFRVVKEN